MKCKFPQLPGFPIFGTGQTSVDGFEKCLEPVLKKYGDEKHVFWVNLRSDNCSEKQQRRKYFNSGIILDKNLWSMSMGSPLLLETQLSKFLSYLINNN